jgi:hypothetical protein
LFSIITIEENSLIVTCMALKKHVICPPENWTESTAILENDKMFGKGA